MDAVRFLFNHFGEFMILIMRLSGVFLMAPVFSAEVIPFKVQGILIMFLALLSFPVLVSKGLLPSPDSVIDLVVMGAGEFFVGFVIGFFVLLVITIFQVSGQFYSIQMGFGIINVYDPLAETSVPIISQLKTLLMTIVFLALRGHQFVLKAVFESYRYIPAAYSLHIAPVKDTMVGKFDQVFHYGFLIGLPLIGMVFLMTVSLGLLSKLVPQMNVMILGFGLKVLIGEFTFVMLLPAFIYAARHFFDTAFRDLATLLMAMGGVS